MASPDSPPTDSDQMATLLLTSPQGLPPSQQNGQTGINKRYRPAPAKTFQCRGYGDCRMVFSRSEHLARHIRKHTGERPFTCHCGKQFSRLDNLRQHAQTVHADKQEQNERMMRDLTSLHASMAAANKATQSRGKRSQAGGPNAPPLSPDDDDLHGGVKQEELPASIPLHQRPGTSTGYEGDSNALMYHQAAPRTWHVQTADLDRVDARSAHNHSFRDPGHPFESHSNSVSPISPQGPPSTSSNSARHPVGVGRPLHLANLPTHIILDPSHPSQLSSPLHSPHPTTGGSPHNRYFPYQAPDGRPPLHVQVPPPQRTTPPTLLSAVSGPEDLDWGGLAGPPSSYPFNPSTMDAPSVSWHTPPPPPHSSSGGHPPHTQASAGPPSNPEMQENLAHPDTTLPFPSTRRRSPTHPPHPSLASDLSQETMMPQSALGPPGATAASHALSLGGSPSWSSAMTPMQMQQLDHFYQFQRQREQAAEAAHQHQHQHHPQHRAPSQHPPPSSHPPHSSHSATYTAGLHRQQQAQLRALQQRRASEEAEAEYNMQQHFAYQQQAHHHQQQQQQAAQQAAFFAMDPPQHYHSHSGPPAQARHTPQLLEDTYRTPAGRPLLQPPSPALLPTPPLLLE
ncbi:hypothetical protein FA95DRAFT_1684227 [Auriscalpium vulgare]|uniref:Uncharacterized protein n=1 Tax=Auriscalpium vulgare TaxID=40419 RepID=A0ACB8R6N7_9AGAM|nr:hypothetical protein FA95DRAFT_1684227 [Auriscalpium vulgare]